MGSCVHPELRNCVRSYSYGSATETVVFVDAHGSMLAMGPHVGPEELV